MQFKFCPFCGKELSDAFAFCPYCGGNIGQFFNRETVAEPAAAPVQSAEGKEEALKTLYVYGTNRKKRRIS